MLIYRTFQMVDGLRVPMLVSKDRVKVHVACVTKRTKGSSDMRVALRLSSVWVVRSCGRVGGREGGFDAMKTRVSGRERV